jgi:hypothetical protein
MMTFAAGFILGIVALIAAMEWCARDQTDPI